MKRQLSSQAQVAKLIRAELKKHNIRAKVTSRSFSMGTSVDVRLNDQSPATFKKIQDYCTQYQYGHFDGMTDMYEYSNQRKDIPQAKFVHVTNIFSNELKQDAYAYLRNHYYPKFKDLPKDYELAQNEYIESWSIRVYDFTYRLLTGFTESNFWSQRKPHKRLTAR